MMCSIRTTFLGSTFYTEPPRAMVKRKWAAWGKSWPTVRASDLLNWDGRHKVQYGPVGGHLVIGGPGEPNRYEGFEEASAVPDSVFEGMAQTVVSETHYMADGTVREFAVFDPARIVDLGDA